MPNFIVSYKVLRQGQQVMLGEEPIMEDYFQCILEAPTWAVAGDAASLYVKDRGGEITQIELTRLEILTVELAARTADEAESKERQK